ncbi:MAG TPA: HD domain-containing phosphohydrolase [Longimicrobiales bacterium]|nr:HD domain-containing phosphohydrolase [Longimicrobiales bacterium]
MRTVRDPHTCIRTAQEAERAGRPREAREHFEAALMALTRPDEAELAPKLLRWIAWALTNEGEPEAALDCLEAGEAVDAANGDEFALASVLNTRAGTLFGLGRLDEAEELFERVQRLAASVGDLKLEAIAHQNLGSVASIRGDLELSLERFKASLASYEALGEAMYVGPLLNNIGRTHMLLLEDDEAEAALLRARDLCEEHGDRHHLVIVEVNRARVMLRGGEALKALRTAEDARALAADAGEDRWLAEILLVSGMAHQRLANPEIALGFLDRAAELSRKRDEPKVLADVILEQARALRAIGRNRDTLVRLNEARQLFEGLRARRDLENVGERFAELEAAFLEIVREWGESIESKDAYTQGHCSRVADFACLLAQAAGFPHDEMMWFRMGALLHDVGKVSVPLAILNKSGKLDDDEWSVISRHPVYGVELLDGIEFPWDVRPMVRHHHERWNGTGYPDRIAGEAIPFEARILTIADIYDALTTTRSYRAAFSHERAMGILASEVGESVDPDLFDLFAREVAPVIAAAGPGGELRAIAV